MIKTRINYGIEQEKREITDILYRLKNKERSTENFAVISEELITNMLGLLKSVKHIDNPYSMEHLNIIYQEFTNRNEEMLFSKDDLFSEGWLISMVEEWDFNIDFKSAYHKITRFCSKKEEQIINFLVQLADFPYKDMLEIIVDNELPSGKLTETKDDNELPSGKLTEAKDGKEIILKNADAWKKYGKIALAYWWDELTETKADTEIWFQCWEILSAHGTPDQYMKHTDEFFKVCLQRLERVKEINTKERIETLLSRRMYISYSHSEKQKDFSEYRFFERNPVEWKKRYERLTDHYSFLMTSNGIVSKEFFACARLYENMDMESRRHFVKIINAPAFMELNRYWRNEPLLLADCLGEADTFLLGAEKIWNAVQEALRKNEYFKTQLVKKIDEYLFGILENRLEWDGNAQWIEALEQLTYYLFTYSYYGSRSHSERNNVIGSALNDYLDWYSGKTVCNITMHEKLLDYLQNEFDKSKGMNATNSFKMYITIAGLSITNTESVSNRMLDAYCAFMKRIPEEDMLTSQISWDFWQSDAWKILFRYFARSEEKLHRFIEAVSLELITEEMEKQTKRSPLFSIGSMEMIHLFMVSNLLFFHKDELGQCNKESVEEYLIDFFWGIQNERCNPFDVENIRLFESDNVVKRWFDCVELFTDEHKNRFMKKLLSQTPEKLLFFIRYIHKDSVKKEICVKLGIHTADELTKNVICIPTEQKLIENMLEICFWNKEDEAFRDKAKNIFTKLHENIHKKGEHFEKQYSEWLTSVQCRFDILDGQEEKVLETGTLFYKAYVYLNREDMDSLQKAEKMFGELYQESSSPGEYLNQYCACVRICTHAECTEKKKKEYLLKAKKIEEDFDNNIEKNNLIGNDIKILFFENRFFLYMSLEDMQAVFKTYARLPDNIKFEYPCAKYVVLLFARTGNLEKANEYLQRLIERYGESESIRELQIEMVEGKHNISEKDFPSKIINAGPKIDYLQNALLQISKLSDYDCAKLRNYSDSEALLVKMVFETAALVEQYNGLFIAEGKPADEDTYNKVFQILFNQKNKEIFDYYAMDQTQEGTARGINKNGRGSKGSLDNAIYHGSRIVSIVEGMILSCCDSQNIEYHTRKLEGYNYVNSQTLFILLYADTKKPLELWENYKKSLQQIAYHGEWVMRELVEKEKIREDILRDLDNIPFFCMTKHYCEATGVEVHKYHILLDIRKDANIMEALAARKIE